MKDLKQKGWFEILKGDNPEEFTSLDVLDLISKTKNPLEICKKYGVVMAKKPREKVKYRSMACQT